MEPMNAFLSSHRQEFKTYIDSICSISCSTSALSPIPPSYSTPLTILQRLPPTSREGFPSLPYLIDHARNFAALVDLWLENTTASAPNIISSDGDLLKFHTLCVSLHQRTQDCLNRAERAERPSSSLSVKWEELVEQLESSSSFELPSHHRKGSISTSTPNSPTDDDMPSSSSTSTPITMKAARPPKSHRQKPSVSMSAPSSSVASAASIIAPTAILGSSRYKARIDNASASGSASTSANEETPPGSADGMSTSALAFTANPNTHINLSHISATRLASGTRSAGGRSLEGSDGALSGGEEYTTALPRFGERERERDRERERKEGKGFRGVLPFKRKPREKGEKPEKGDKDKDKDKDRDKGERSRVDKGDR